MNPRARKTLILCLVAGLAMSAGPAFGWWYVEDRRSAGLDRVEIEIPDGTATEIAAGVRSTSIPSNLKLAAHSTLVVRNLDSVVHQFGPLWIPPGAESVTAASSLLGEAQNSFLCTFHSAGSITLTPTGAATPLRALVMTAFAGIPLALIGYGVASITQRL
jgi:hypothetical protein